MIVGPRRRWRVFRKAVDNVPGVCAGEQDSWPKAVGRTYAWDTGVPATQVGVELTESVLSSVALFSGLDAPALSELERRFVRKQYRRKTVLIEHGIESSAMYVLLQGGAQVFIADDGGREIVLNELGPGDHFGELALVADMPRSASVMTTQDSVCLSMTRHTFIEFLSEYPEISFNLIRHLAGEVSRLSEDMARLALHDVYRRVRDLLDKMAQPRADKPEIRTTGQITQQDIANRVGASREMISRIFRDLKKGGYIELQGRQLAILRPLPLNW